MSSLSHDLLVWLVALPAQRTFVIWCCLCDRFMRVGVVSAFWIGVVLVAGAQLGVCLTSNYLIG